MEKQHLWTIEHQYIYGWDRFGEDNYATRRDADNALASFLEDARELHYDKEDFRIATVEEVER